MANPETVMGGGEIGEEVGCRANLISYYFGISEEMAGNPVFQEKFLEYVVWEGRGEVAKALSLIEMAEQSGRGDGYADYTVRKLMRGPEGVAQGEDGEVVVTGEVYEPDALTHSQDIRRIKMLALGGVGVFDHSHSVVDNKRFETCRIDTKVVARGYDNEGKLRSYASLDNHGTADLGTSIDSVDFSKLDDLSDAENGATLNMVSIFPNSDSSEVGSVRFHVQRRDRLLGERHNSGEGVLSVEDDRLVINGQDRRLDETTDFKIHLSVLFDEDVASEFYEATYDTSLPAHM